jgi:hypothetical protein
MSNCRISAARDTSGTQAKRSTAHADGPALWLGIRWTNPPSTRRLRIAAASYSVLKRRSLTTVGEIAVELCRQDASASKAAMTHLNETMTGSQQWK